MMPQFRKKSCFQRVGAVAASFLQEVLISYTFLSLQIPFVAPIVQFFQNDLCRQIQSQADTYWSGMALERQNAK